MRALVAFGSKRGGTAELAEFIAADLARRGVPADVVPAGTIRSLDGYDAVVVAGALYNARWHRDAAQFVRSHAIALRERPVWFVSSGPLGAAAREREIPPIRQVGKLMDRVGARGHVTFGGRLTPDAQGFIAKQMAKKMAGDWRDRDRVREWVDTVVGDLNSSKVA